MSGRKNEDGTALRPEALVALLVVGTGVYLARSGRLWVLVLGGALAVIMVAACWAVVPSRVCRATVSGPCGSGCGCGCYPGPRACHGAGPVAAVGPVRGLAAQQPDPGHDAGLVPGSAPRLPLGALGRAHYRHGLRASLDSHVVVLSPPRKGKSGWLARVINHYPGPVVSTTTKADVFKLTSGLRSRVGPRPRVQPAGHRRHPLHVPLGSAGGLPGPCSGDPPGRRVRRCDQHQGRRGRRFLARQSLGLAPGDVRAAALAGLSMQDVADWVLTGDTRYPETVLAEAGYPKWAAQLAEMRSEASQDHRDRPHDDVARAGVPDRPSGSPPQ